MGSTDDKPNPFVVWSVWTTSLSVETGKVNKYLDYIGFTYKTPNW